MLIVSIICHKYKYVSNIKLTTNPLHKYKWYSLARVHDNRKLFSKQSVINVVACKAIIVLSRATFCGELAIPKCQLIHHNHSSTPDRQAIPGEDSCQLQDPARAICKFQNVSR